MTIRSPADGTFVVPQIQDLPGQFIKQGTQVGYVLDLAALTVRVVVSQDDIDLVRQRLHGVEVRLAERRGPASARGHLAGSASRNAAVAEQGAEQPGRRGHCH